LPNSPPGPLTKMSLGLNLLFDFSNGPNKATQFATQRASYKSSNLAGLGVLSLRRFGTRVRQRHFSFHRLAAFSLHLGHDAFFGGHWLYRLFRLPAAGGACQCHLSDLSDRVFPRVCYGGKFQQYRMVYFS
jgi:hypothetical protein